MLRSGKTRRKPPGQVRPAIIRVHNCDVSGLQISHEGRKDSGDGGDTSALVPAPVLHVIVYWGSLELDAFPFENFSDRPIRMMQHDQGRESRSVKVGYQAKRGQMTSADIVLSVSLISLTSTYFFGPVQIANPQEVLWPKFSLQLPWRASD